MSDTPRTDACIQQLKAEDFGWHRLVDLAELLECELTAANERINALTQENELGAQSIKYMDAKTRSLCERIAELERGEFICRKCGLRKDADFARGDF